MAKMSFGSKKAIAKVESAAIEVEKTLPVEVEKIVYRTIEVPVEKIVEVVKHVEVEVEKLVTVTKEVEKFIEKEIYKVPKWVWGFMTVETIMLIVLLIK